MLIKLNKSKDKKTKRNKLLSILILSFIYYKILNSLKKIKLVIQVDISRAKQGKGGPVVLQRGISKVLPYESKYCKFIPADGIYPNDIKNIDYFLISFPSKNEKIYDEWIKINRVNSLLLGPDFVPQNWYKFPNKNVWYERKFRKILSEIKGVVVHSNRVRDHLMLKSSTQDLINKYIFLRSCSYNLPNDIKPFQERENDIILFQKYADSDHRKQGEQLLSLLKGTNKKIKQLNYGNYKREDEFLLANNTKFIKINTVFIFHFMIVGLLH